MRAVLTAAGAVAVLAAVAIAVLPATPVSANGCSCGAREFSEVADQVDAAFLGRKISRATSTTVFTMKGIDEEQVWPEARMILEVIWVYKGDLGPRVEIHSSFSSYACGVDFVDPRSPVFVAYQDGDELFVGTCDNFTISDLEAEFGAGNPPAESADPQGLTESRASPPPISGTSQPDTPVEPQSPVENTPPPEPPPDSLPPEASQDSQDTQRGSESATSLIITLVVVAAVAGLTVWLRVARRRARSTPPLP